MKHYVYLIVSFSNKKIVSYVGYTHNLKKRIALHNSSKGAKFTKGRKWELIYKRVYYNKSLAMKEEYKLKKNYKLRNEIKNKFYKKFENFNYTSL